MVRAVIDAIPIEWLDRWTRKHFMWHSIDIMRLWRDWTEEKKKTVLISGIVPDRYVIRERYNYISNFYSKDEYEMQEQFARNKDEVAKMLGYEILNRFRIQGELKCNESGMANTIETDIDLLIIPLGEIEGLDLREEQ